MHVSTARWTPGGRTRSCAHNNYILFMVFLNEIYRLLLAIILIIQVSQSTLFVLISRTSQEVSIELVFQTVSRWSCQEFAARMVLNKRQLDRSRKRRINQIECNDSSSRSFNATPEQTSDDTDQLISGLSDLTLQETTRRTAVGVCNLRLSFSRKGLFPSVANRAEKSQHRGLARRR